MRLMLFFTIFSSMRRKGVGIDSGTFGKSSSMGSPFSQPRHGILIPPGRMVIIGSG
jgi:hypothetical protein